MLSLAALTGLACAGRDVPRDRPTGGPGVEQVVDDFGDTLRLTGVAPHRIVSLNPATTAMLFAMGDGGRLVGRSRWDTYPPAALAVPSVGDGLRPNIEAVLSTHPDLVVLYASADDRDAEQRLRTAGIATLSVRNDHLADFRRTLGLLGRAVHDSEAARRVADSVDATIARVRAATAARPPVRLVWIIDGAPLRVIGGGSYLSELARDAGGENLYGADARPAPEVSLEDVLERDPTAVLTTPNEATTLRSDPRWRRWLADSAHRILVPDSALVGLPSVRMGQAAIALARLLQPGAVAR